MALKNYYQILEIGTDASENDIKTAFRSQARKFHPDVNSMPDASERFQDVVEAFDVLSNTERRRDFDQMLKNRERGVTDLSEEFTREEWEKRSEARSKKYREFPLDELLMLGLFAETGVIDGLLDGMGNIIDSAADALDGLSDLF